MVSSTADPTTSPTTSPMELSPEEFLSIFCDRYTKWHSCAIVGIFVGSLVLVYSIWSLNRRREWFRGYEEYQNLDDNSVRRKISLYRRLFLCIVAVSIFMITTVFSVLVASQAHILGSKEPYNGLKPGAIAYIVTLGFGIGLFALGIFAKVILKPMEEFIREIS
ncbi:unnamed protein product [Allacma fusca]|uniref:Uncharacterized protein n=1 Tax=Allacma fusca TaxID=39272 RepID=A0A8J2PRC0_9HEXA|nr:unnamed protein product [Allacma fusca]